MKTWKTKSGYEIIRLLSGRSNAFLLTNGEKNILIDTSVSRLWSRFQHRLKRLGIAGIDYLILTHAHFDHAANANKIKEKYKTTVIVQKEEANYLANGDNILPKGTTILTKPIVNVLGKRLFSRFKYEPCQPDILVDSEYDLSTLGFNAYLIHTPGHTAGSMSLIIDYELAIVGDAMFGVFKWSVFPPFAEDEKLMIKSWGKLLQTKCHVFIPSHGTANIRSLVQKDYNKRNK
jgi:glyoxylase-like metal-dependent hydrolase (beta-lactamase superfamily II)